MTPDLTARGKLVILIDDGGFEWEDVHAALDAIEGAAVAEERKRLRAAILGAGMFESCGGEGCTEERNDELGFILALIDPESPR
jgi:hypothetical protein